MYSTRSTTQRKTRVHTVECIQAAGACLAVAMLVCNHQRRAHGFVCIRITRIVFSSIHIFISFIFKQKQLRSGNSAPVRQQTQQQNQHSLYTQEKDARARKETKTMFLFVCFFKLLYNKFLFSFPFSLFFIFYVCVLVFLCQVQRPDRSGTSGSRRLTREADASASSRILGKSDQQMDASDNMMCSTSQFSPGNVTCTLYTHSSCCL